jgi:uncharacterized protein YndB with AHSA1/START domain
MMIHEGTMSKLIVEDAIEIQASGQRVWTVLTDSQFIQQYMFGCVADTDWQTGSDLLWKGGADGQLYVKGKIVMIDAPRRLEYTVLGADMKIADIPENYLTIVYDVTEQKPGVSRLHVSMGDFNTVGEGKRRHDESVAGGGWAPMLEKIKALAEGA